MDLLQRLQPAAPSAPMSLATHTHADLLNGELLFRLDHAGGHLLERGEFWTVRRILKRGRTAS